MRNNICWQNTYDEVVGAASNTTNDHNLAGVDPLFVDAASNDFHLQPSSPAIDNGMVVLPDQEYGGAAPDLGAFESESGATGSGGPAESGVGGGVGGGGAGGACG